MASPVSSITGLKVGIDKLSDDYKFYSYMENGVTPNSRSSTTALETKTTKTFPLQSFYLL